MAEDTSQDGAIHIRCVCGEELRLSPELLGRVLVCPHCKRYLRTALQFLLVEQEAAPNLTAVCTCGRFIIEKASSAGKTVTCKMCGQRVVLPMPLQRRDDARVVRIPPQALEKQLSRARGRRKAQETPQAEAERIKTAGFAGRISLRPGQEV